MILATVGTHEQPFNRLVSGIDSLIKAGRIESDIFIQRGINTETPVNCHSEEIISYKKMIEMMKRAEIIITHGGLGSILSVISLGKIPIVFPRLKMFGEHVDDHQYVFTKWLEKNNKIIAAYDIESLEMKVAKYEVYCGGVNRWDDNKTNKNRMTLIENLNQYTDSL